MAMLMAAPANAVVPTGTQLRFRSDGKFKIMQITDLHWSPIPGWNDNSKATIERIADIEKPDLAVFTGDLGGNPTCKEAAEQLVEIFRSRGILLAYAPGNHDHDFPEGDAVMDFFQSQPGCLAVKNSVDPETLYGYINQVLPIMSSTDPKKKAYALYILDSNREGLHTNQVQWYVKQSNALKRENGGKPLPSLVYMHIPTQEFNLACQQAVAENQMRVKGGATKVMGWRLENNDPEQVNSGFFAACREQGDVRGICCGHDHDISFVTLYHNIALINGQYSGGVAPYHALCCGARLIELTEGSEGFETWVRLESTRFLYRLWVPETFTSDNPKYKPWP